MNEQRFGNKVRHLLNQGLELDSASREQLRAAREQALARQRAEAPGAFVRAGDLLAGVDGWRGFSIRVLLPLAVLALAIAGIHTWQERQRLAELVEIDSELLADDLPIDAYLDRGFQNWLKNRAAEK
jgi:uncharacterized iron-regulated membrane protein